MGNCSSSAAVLQSTTSTDKWVSKDFTERTCSKCLTESCRSEDFKNSSSMVLGLNLCSKPFDNTLPPLDEHELHDCSSHSSKSAMCYRMPEPSVPELGATRYAYDNMNDATKDPSGRPILCVMAEVPGDKPLGLTALSHPLLVEAVESLFTTVGITIEDRANVTRHQPWLDRKAWLTTLHILDDRGSELVPPIGGDMLTIGLVTESMIAALRRRQIRVPTYLQFLHEEESAKQQVTASGAFKTADRTAVFGVSDGHEAEVDFAGIDGVIRTQLGTCQGQIVIQVNYTGKTFATIVRQATEDPNHRVNTVYYSTMDQRVAAQMELGKRANPPPLVELQSDEQILFSVIPDTKRALRKTELRYVPMTSLQATRANRLVHKGSFHSATHLLSPRQGAILMQSYSRVSLRKDTVDIPIDKSWMSLNATSSQESDHDLQPF